MSEAEAIVKLDSDSNRLVLQADFPQLTTEQLFAYFTEPELLCAWWTQGAELEPRPGGHYHFWWPAMDWHLRGEILEFVTGERLRFTWKWDHEPDMPLREVELTFTRRETGSRLILVHGFYTDTPVDQTDRREHLEGWLHYLMHLQKVLETG